MLLVSGMTKLVARVKCVVQVHARQDCKDIGLDANHHHLKTVDRYDAEDWDDSANTKCAREAREHFDHRVTSHHVTHQTNGVADWADEVRDQLDQKQDQPHWPRG